MITNLLCNKGFELVYLFLIFGALYIFTPIVILKSAYWIFGSPLNSCFKKWSALSDPEALPSMEWVRQSGKSWAGASCAFRQVTSSLRFLGYKNGENKQSLFRMLWVLNKIIHMQCLVHSVQYMLADVNIVVFQWISVNFDWKSHHCFIYL